MKGEAMSKNDGETLLVHVSKCFTQALPLKIA
jgi:hypothetical protein